MILPGKFGAINNEVAEADSYDVRQNLKTWHREERNTDEYCVVFRVEKAMKSCKLNEDTKSLVRGADGEHNKYCHLFIKNIFWQERTSACRARASPRGRTWVTGARATAWSRG